MTEYATAQVDPMLELAKRVGKMGPDELLQLASGLVKFGQLELANRIILHVNGELQKLAVASWTPKPGEPPPKEQP